MRILLVHNRYRNPGGEERHLELLSRSLTEAGAEVRLLVVDSSSLRTRRSRIATALTLPYSPASFRRMRDEVRFSGADVVHFHNFWPILTPAALRGARQAGAGVVLTVHNYRFACPFGTLLRRGEIHDECLDGSSLVCGLRGAGEHGLRAVAYGLALELHRRLGWLERWVDAFVTPAEFVRGALVRAGLERERVHLIRNSVPSRSPGRSRASVSEPSYALYAGRLAREKGLEVLVEAARLAPEVPIVVAGSGPLEASLRLDRPGSVELVGHQEQERLARLQAGSSMSLLPSTCYEVAPYAALEAAAAGKPVVATDIGGIPEIVSDGQTGLLVAPGDPVALASAIRRLWHDPALAATLGAQAAVRIRREHSLSDAARQHLALYRQVVSA